jgi:uncharacterized cupin superfamily protein
MTQTNFDVGPQGRWAPCGITDVSGRIESDGLAVFDGFPEGSRTVVSMWRAPVGVYASPGQPTDEIFMVRSGRAIVRLDGTEHRIAAGSVFHLPAGIPFEFDVSEEFVKMAVSAR